MATVTLTTGSTGTDQYKIACPTCHGQGKTCKLPSRKARLRHKSVKTLENDDPKDSTSSPLPLRLDPCSSCQQTGLIETNLPVTPNATYPHVAIIGGGLGGLALGVACMHRQIPFSIFERDHHFYQRSQGYGLTMQQASRALKGFGISELQEGITSTKHIVHTIDGNVVGEWGLRKWGRDPSKRPPKRQNIHIARQALRHELLQALDKPYQDSAIHWGHKLTNISLNKNDCPVELEFEVDNHPEPARKFIFTKPNMLVVGADGIRSTVRGYLIDMNIRPLRYLNCLVVLGICPLSVLDKKTQENHLMDGETVFQTADGSTRIYLMPFSLSEYMWQLSFPMSNEEVAKELSNAGPKALKAEVLVKCRDWHNPIPEILERTPVDKVSGYPVYDRELVTIEDFKSTLPMTLIGDAAHPMSPFKGQGANQALLDALLLAKSLYSKCCLKNGTLNEALREYHEEMIERSAVKVQASAQAAEFLHTQVAIQQGNVTRGAAASSGANLTCKA